MLLSQNLSQEWQSRPGYNPRSSQESFCCPRTKVRQMCVDMFPEKSWDSRSEILDREILWDSKSEILIRKLSQDSRSGILDQEILWDFRYEILYQEISWDSRSRNLTGFQIQISHGTLDLEFQIWKSNGTLDLKGPRPGLLRFYPPYLLYPYKQSPSHLVQGFSMLCACQTHMENLKKIQLPRIHERRVQ